MTYLSHLLAVLIIGASCSTSFGFAGGVGSSGGGDAVKADFLVSARLAQQILIRVGSDLKPAVDPQKFKLAMDPDHIISTDETLTDDGHIVDAYYDQATDLISVNRQRWQSNKQEVKVKLAAHEIFRRMGLDDDKYQISSQLNYFGGVTLKITFEITKRNLNFTYTDEEFRFSDVVWIPMYSCALTVDGYSTCRGTYQIDAFMAGHVAFVAMIEVGSASAPGERATYSGAFNLWANSREGRVSAANFFEFSPVPTAPHSIELKGEPMLLHDSLRVSEKAVFTERLLIEPWQ
ncbi:MAG: hypothetical protein AB7O96_10815 [Pseudobdellovibrionaceae bacterium]